jgi:O-methyltransferase
LTSTKTPTVCRLLVPAYNEAARIVRCLESVKASYLPAGFEWGEWAVRDDDSTDGTPQLAESWAANRPLIPLRVVRAARRSGKAAALGAYHAELIAQGLLGHLVVVLDADLAVVPGALDSLLRAFAQDPSLGVAWGMDQIDSRNVGHWASAYQMEAMGALAHRLGTNAPRAYGRFFAYRVAALADFCWQAGLIADDTQLADFVCEHSVPARTVEEARVLVTPAASGQDFHLQTQKSFAARTRLPGEGWREPALDRMGAAAITAARHPLWAVAYATARGASSARQRLSPTSFGDLWVPPATTKQAIEAGLAKRSGPAGVLTLVRMKFCLASNARRVFRNWTEVWGRVALSWLGRLIYRTPIIRDLLDYRYQYMFSPAQLAFLCEQITNVADVSGSILEVGCESGKTTVFLNRHIDNLGMAVDYYVIDTFSGFTMNDIEFERALGRDYPYQVDFGENSKARFDRTMRRNGVERVASFQADATTFDYAKISPFRMALVDVDLYRPVLSTLNAIYDLVSPGGIIVTDDCQQGGKWEGAYEAFAEFTKAKGIEPVIVHGKLGVIIKPRSSPVSRGGLV